MLCLHWGGARGVNVGILYGSPMCRVRVVDVSLLFFLQVSPRTEVSPQYPPQTITDDLRSGSRPGAAFAFAALRRAQAAHLRRGRRARGLLHDELALVRHPWIGEARARGKRPAQSIREG